MQNKLLLSLWLGGAALYLAGTLFLAHAILGAGSRSQDLANRAKATTVATAPEAQCAPSAAATSAEASKPADAQASQSGDEAKAAADPAPATNGAPKEQVKTAAAPFPHGEGTGQTADGDAAPQLPPDEADAEGPDAGPDSGPDGQAMTPDANPGQGGAEWARVAASAAEVHTQPFAESPPIYSLPAGRQVRVLSRDHEWAQVQDVASGGTGWVDARALAPMGAPGRGGYDNGYGDDAYAEGGPDDWRWRRRHREGFIGDFVRRALGGW
jgi:hypothetical protein